MSGAPQTRTPHTRAPQPHVTEEHGPEPQAPTPPGRTGAPVKLLMVVAAVIAALLILGTLPRLFRQSKINHDAEQVKSSVPTVMFVLPHRVTEEGITLPGNIEGSMQTTIQARTSGYIDKIHVDIGSRVRKGELLAEISSPDLDQQVMQAQAQTAQALAAKGQADAALAHSRQQLQVERAALVQQRAQVAQSTLNFNRSRQLWGAGLVARQDAETALTALRSQRANVKSAEAAVRAAQADIASAQKGVHSAQSALAAAQANERRYRVLRAFEQVRAPFDGVITARNVDPGALVNSGGSASGATTASGNAPAATAGPTASTGLFQIANSDTVKITVQVPETFAPGVQAGGSARVTVRELPGRVFNGVINVRSGALDVQSRTLQAEIDIPNRTHELLPGMFARVRLTPANPPTMLRIPDSALITDAEGVRVAVVGPDNRIHFQEVRTGRDFGDEIEVPAGLQDGAHLVDNPTSQLREGQEVRPQPEPARQPRGGGGAAGGGDRGPRGGRAREGGPGRSGEAGAPAGGSSTGPGGAGDGAPGGRGSLGGSEQGGSRFAPTPSAGGAPASPGSAVGGGGAAGGSRP